MQEMKDGEKVSLFLPDRFSFLSRILLISDPVTFLAVGNGFGKLVSFPTTQFLALRMHEA